MSPTVTMPEVASLQGISELTSKKSAGRNPVSRLSTDQSPRIGTERAFMESIEHRRARQRAAYAADPEPKKLRVAIYRALNVEKVQESNRISVSKYQARKKAERALGGSDG